MCDDFQYFFEGNFGELAEKKHWKGAKLKGKDKNVFC